MSAKQAQQSYPVVPASVSFHENTLLTAEFNGKQYAAMKPIVEGMGMEWGAQQQKIRKSKRYGDIDIPLQTPGGIQKMVCMPINKLNGWLFSVNADKVKPEIREKIRQYQEECFVVLHDYWHKGGAVHDRPRIESAQADPARLAESLMQALIASLSGSHNDKIDDLGCEVVSRLEDITGQLSDISGQPDLLPTLHVLNSNVSNLRRQVVNILPKLSIPDDLIDGLRTVAARLTAIADQQDNRDFSFHERLRALEMLFRGVELKQTANLIQGEPGIFDYLEGNLPPSLRYMFNMTLVPKAAGSTMLLRFMNECLIPDLDSRIELQRLYPVYCAWCYANMNSPVPLTSFKKLLNEYVSKFSGMRLKMENYVQYLQGARIRIPREIRPAATMAELPDETTGEKTGASSAKTTAEATAKATNKPPGANPAEPDVSTTAVASGEKTGVPAIVGLVETTADPQPQRPPETPAVPQPRKFKDFASRIFGGKGGE